MKISVGCIVWSWLRMLQDWTFVKFWWDYLDIVGDVILWNSWMIPRKAKEGSDPDGYKYYKCFIIKWFTTIVWVYIKLIMGIGVVGMCSIWLLVLILIDWPTSSPTVARQRRGFVKGHQLNWPTRYLGRVTRFGIGQFAKCLTWPLQALVTFLKKGG